MEAPCALRFSRIGRFNDPRSAAAPNLVVSGMLAQSLVRSLRAGLEACGLRRARLRVQAASLAIRIDVLDDDVRLRLRGPAGTWRMHVRWKDRKVALSCTEERGGRKRRCSAQEVFQVLLTLDRKVLPATVEDGRKSWSTSAVFFFRRLPAISRTQAKTLRLFGSQVAAQRA